MNSYLTKIAEGTNHSETNKAFAKTMAYGTAGGTAGTIGGALLGASKIGQKASAGIGKLVAPVKKALGESRLAKSKIGMAVAGGVGVGGFIGSHLGGAAGDYAASHSIVNSHKKEASKVNKYLDKVAGLAGIAEKIVGSKAAGSAVNAGLAMKGALSTPVGKGVAIGAGGVLAGMGAKKMLSGSKQQQG